MPIQLVYGNPRKPLARKQVARKLKRKSIKLRHGSESTKTTSKEEKVNKKGATTVAKKKKSKSIKRKKATSKKKRSAPKRRRVRRAKRTAPKRRIKRTRKPKTHVQVYVKKGRKKHRKVMEMVANPRRKRRIHRRRINPDFKAIFKGDNVLGMGHTQMELASLLVGGLAYGMVTGAVVKYAAPVLNPIESVLGKLGPKAVQILGPAIPALMVGIPLHIVAKKYVKNNIAVQMTRGLLAATVIGLGSSAASALFGVGLKAPQTAGIPQLRGYDFTPMAGVPRLRGYDFTPMAGPSADFGQPVSKADFGRVSDSADFGSMGRYVTAGEAQAMGGYDTSKDFGQYPTQDEEDYQEGLGSLG